MEPNYSSCHLTENITTAVDAEEYKYSVGGIVYTLGFFPLIILVGLIDNLAFIVVVARVPRMQTSTNCYLINLAVADLIFLLTGTTEKLYRYSQSSIHGDDTPIKNGGCVWVYLVSDTTYYAALSFVSLVSIERYCAVCRPQSRYVFNKRKTYILSFLSWLVSFCIAITLVPSTSSFVKICLMWPNGKFIEYLPNAWGICTAVRPWVRVFGNFMQTIPFFVAMAINTTMYVLIVRGLNNSMRRLRKHSVATTDIDSRMRDQIARMLVINGVAFFSCLAPFEILSSLDTLSFVTKRALIETNTFTSLIYTARALAYINCVINPIIYMTMSQRYRNAFWQTFCRNKKCTGQSCTAKYLGSTTQDHQRTTVCDSRV